MRLRVKICGVTRPEDALAAIELGADAIGLIFAASKRQVTPAQAAAVVAALPPWFPAVGVFSDASPLEIAAVLAECPLTHLQFHGREDLAGLASLRRPFVKALPLVTDQDLEAARALVAARPDLRLLADAAHGGSGQRCDWARAAQLARVTPLILAGGLTPENVADAVRAVRPAAVDVSSGVEAAPGLKDRHRLEAFIAAARAA